MAWEFEDISRILRQFQAVMGLWGLKYSEDCFQPDGPLSPMVLELGGGGFPGKGTMTTGQCPVLWCFALMWLNRKHTF